MSAEYGFTLGGVINVATKAGTNDYHGTAYEFLRRSGMDAKNYFDRADLAITPFRRDQFGATLGGPIKRSKMFFFLNYEGLTQSLGLTRVLTVPDLNARAGLLPIGPGASLVNVGVDPRVAPYMKFWPAPNTVIGGGQGIATLNPTQTAHENYVIARVDSTFSNSDSLFVRYVSDMATVDDPTLLRTMFYLWERLKLVVEPTGALGAAAALAGTTPIRGARVGVVLSGGNVDLLQVSEWLALRARSSSGVPIVRLSDFDASMKTPLWPERSFQCGRRDAMAASGTIFNESSSVLIGQSSQNSQPYE